MINEPKQSITMNNKYLTTLCITAATALLGACGESIVDAPTEQGVPLQIASVSIAPSQTVTRTGEITLDKGEMGLFQYWAKNDPMNLTEYIYTKSTPAGNWMSKSYIRISNQPTTIYAYYPHQPGAGPTNIPVSIQQFSDESGADLSLAYSAEGTRLTKSQLTSGTKIPITLTHACFKMTIKVRTQDAAMEGIEITHFTLTDCPIKASRNFYEETYSVKEAGSFVCKCPITLPASGSSKVLTYLVIPPNDETGTKYSPKYTLTVDGVEMTGRGSLPMLKAGQACTVTLTVDPRKVKVEQVTFDPWTIRNEEAEI